MIRGLLGLLIIVGSIAAAIFFSDHPGRVDIVWQGWRVETSVGVLAAAALLAGLAAALLFWLVSLIIDSPRAFLRRFTLCRICFRKLALAGEIPGVTKASW